ncbi:MAG: 16S rRNA (cytidine(1402)-2'-O)-methyltransferase [Chloroflexi bacterium]|nr:16S rRNA (cytidine(1402)-2'-O)-methyltransferase [Chloroflexota bacterium]
MKSPSTPNPSSPRVYTPSSFLTTTASRCPTSSPSTPSPIAARTSSSSTSRKTTDLSPLYIVATPIGNLEDITARALRTLREVRLIAAEDTRQTAKLLTHFNIATPTTSYFEHNKLAKLDYILEQLQAGDVALVSDGGLPGLSDPGYELIREAIARGITVVPIPGPSAIPTALVASGLPTDAFVYLGFLPRKSGDRARLLTLNADDPRTLICLEAPHRLLDTLAEIQHLLGDRRVAVCRELTKLHEEIFRGTVSEALTRFSPGEVRGEITLVLEGRTELAAPEPWDEARIRAALRDLLALGLERKEAAKQIAAQSGWERREVYKIATEL